MDFIEMRNKLIENFNEITKDVTHLFEVEVDKEDLWDLSVNDLDLIYKKLNKWGKESKTDSLLNVEESSDTELEIQIAIVKYIVAVKLAEKEASEKALVKKEQKQKIMSIIAAKENKELENNSIDDLKKMLDELGE